MARFENRELDAFLSNQMIVKHECKSHVFDLDFLRQLEINTDVKCAFCDETFSQDSALKFHSEKVHGMTQAVNKGFDEYTKTKSMSKSDKLKMNCNCKYFCSIENCKFHINSAKKHSLPTFHSLKNHFIRIHGERRFSCSKHGCDKQFAIKSEKIRHEIRFIFKSLIKLAKYFILL